MTAAASGVEPARPEGVPDSATFDTALGGWVSVATDEQGRRHGLYRVFRSDGTLLLSSEYDAGVPVGSIVEYHPSGAVRSEGHYQGGKLDGVFAYYRSDEPGAKPLRSCCVPRGSRQLRLYYQAGRVRSERFFDDQGRALRADGTPLPEMPSGLPVYTDFDEANQRWVLRESLPDGGSALRSFDLAGELVEEAETHGGRRRTVRTFARGALLEEKSVDDQGRLSGPYRRVYVEDSPYADSSIREERGQFAEGHPVGTWEFFDGEGRLVAHVERGKLSSQQRFVELACEPLGESEETSLRVQALRSQGAVREALWLAARLHHRAPERSPLLAMLPQLVVPVAERQQLAWQRLLDGRLPNGRRLDVHLALDALLAGARPCDVLRVLASLAKEGSPAALELVQGALAFEPDNPRALANQAMLRLEVGALSLALTDADELSRLGESAAAEQLRATARAMFPEFTFAATVEPPNEPEEPLQEVGVEQPLAAIDRVMRLYATRLSQSREKLLRWAHPSDRWLPPELTALMADGPVELERKRVTIEDETEQGVERSEVEVDETAGTSGETLQAVLATARADWDALCWLAWAVGQDTLERPRAVEPPLLLAAAINEAMGRCWQLHDLLRTGGLAARTRAVPDFEWQGFRSSRLPRSLLYVAAQQYTERRAMFFWLLFPQNVSPFQSDLRKT